MEDDSPTRWRQDALCRNVSPEVFFPPKGGSSREAKRICALCPVKAPCLEFALEQESLHDTSIMSGIYAGLSPKERAALRKAS